MRTPKLRTFATLTLPLWTVIFFIQPFLGRAQSINQVLSFDGTSAYVSVPNAADLQNPTEITVEAWVRPDPAGGTHQTFLSKGDGESRYTDRAFEIVWSAESGNSGTGNRIEVSFFVGTVNWAVLGAPALAGQWVHVAATYRSSDGLHQLFTNGVLAASSTIDVDLVTSLAGQPLRQSSPPLYLGKLGYNYSINYARGYMDEIRIWNKARTPNEIRESMYCRLAGSEPNLAGYWNFEDGTAKDVTGHGHNGTFAGNAQVVPTVGSDAVHAGLCGAAYPIPPVITTQPRSRVLLAGSSVGLTVSATSTRPLTYQWRKGNNNIPGATTDVFWLTNIQAAQAASYSVVVSNAVEAIESQDALLEVVPYTQSLIPWPTSAGGNDHLYALTSRAYTNWAEAEAEALSWNGHLVSITSQGEQDFVQQVFLTAGGRMLQEPFWIGLNDLSSPGKFGWTTDEPLTFSYWNPGEPTAFEDAVAINWHFAYGYGAFGTWNNFPTNSRDKVIRVNSGPYFGIIEITPRTVTATANAVVIKGFIVDATIIEGGAGYTNTPIVRVIGGSASGAQAVAVVSNGVVTAVNVLDAGSGYTNKPVIVIAPPFIPRPTIGITALLFGPIATPVIKLDIANLSPYDKYQLEFSPGPGGNWTNLGAPFIPTTVTSTQYTDAIGNLGFLRVKHVP